MAIKCMYSGGWECVRTGVTIGCNKMTSDEQTGRLVCVILPVERLLDTQTGLLEVEWHVSPCLSRGPQKFG